MIKDDTWYRCTVCGREGRVGRCCGYDTREPMNDAAREEQRQIAADREREELKNRVLYRATTFG